MNLFVIELYKALRKKEIWILVIGGIILEIWISSTNNVILPSNVDIKVYKYYIHQIEGDYTDEKSDLLISERDRYQEYLENRELYDEQFRNDEISAADYREILNSIKEAEARIGTLEYLIKRSMYLEQLNDTTDKVQYFYDIDINDYVENMGIDIVVIMLITVIIVHIFGEDYNCNTHNMIITSQNGRKRVYLARLKCALLVSGLIGTIFPVIELITKSYKYHLGNLNSNIECLSSMSESSINLSIKNYLILCMMTRIVCAIFYGIIVMGITIIIKSMISDYIIVIAIIYLPYIMYEQVGKYINMISLCKGFAVYQGYRNPQNIFGIHGMIVWFVIYTIISICIIQWCKKISQ